MTEYNCQGITSFARASMFSNEPTAADPLDSLRRQRVEYLKHRPKIVYEVISDRGKD